MSMRSQAAVTVVTPSPVCLYAITPPVDVLGMAGWHRWWAELTQCIKIHEKRTQTDVTAGIGVGVE